MFTFDQVAAGPVLSFDEELEAVPEPQAAGEVGGYVASRVAVGRPIFDVLGDPFVQDRCDSEPNLLGRLARDTEVLSALGATLRSRPTG
jgi:hypothetical protein